MKRPKTTFFEIFKFYPYSQIVTVRVETTCRKTLSPWTDNDEICVIFFVDIRVRQFGRNKNKSSFDSHKYKWIYSFTRTTVFLFFCSIHSNCLQLTSTLSIYDVIVLDFGYFLGHALLRWKLVPFKVWKCQNNPILKQTLIWNNVLQKYFLFDTWAKQALPQLLIIKQNIIT